MKFAFILAEFATSNLSTYCFFVVFSLCNFILYKCHYSITFFAEMCLMAKNSFRTNLITFIAIRIESDLAVFDGQLLSV